MSNGLGQWARDLRKRVRHIAKRDGEQEPELPYLPSYPSPISLAATANSAIFVKLPPEVRRKILVAAFGGRRQHMHLRLGPPLLPPSERPPIPSGLRWVPHGGITADLDLSYPPSSATKELMDAVRRARVITPGTKPVWQWWGCECHRLLPPGDDRVIVIQPWQDTCVNGEAQNCYLYPGEAPQRCQVGCMGWLLACRQAYSEGIHVLYGTNTIFIKSGKLIETLLLSTSDRPSPQRVLVPPHHVALLTKLELVWDWALFLRPEYFQRQAVHRADMARSLDLLPQAFPNLVIIVISYSDNLYQRLIPPIDFLSEIDQELLLPLSKMASQFSRLNPNKCVVELPTNTFHTLLGRAYRSGSEVDKELGRSWMGVRFWWEPDGDMKKKDGGSSSTDENQPEQMHRPKGKGRAGFWINPGVESNLYFDYMSQPKSLSAQPSVLL